MKDYGFDIDLMWIAAEEPENWFETIQVPLTDEEAVALANAIIDYKFLLPKQPFDDISGDDHLIIKYAPQVRPRIQAQMIEEAADHGWKEFIPLFNRVNICFGSELWVLAKSMDRWKELEKLKAKK